MQWLSEHWSTIVTVVSLVLNALGGVGIVKPVANVRKSKPTDD